MHSLSQGGDFWAKAARLRRLAPIMASICLIGTGNSVLTTSVSLRLSQPDVDTQSVQLLLTGFPVGFLAGCLAAPFLVNRFGHRAVFLSVGFLAMVASFGYMATADAVAWFCLRVLNGFAMATLFVVCESWINLYADHRNRGAYFSLYMLMTSLAVFFGQLLIEVAGPHSSHLFLIGVLTTSLGFLYCGLTGHWPALPSRMDGAQQGAAAGFQRFGLWRIAVLAPVTIFAVFQSGMTNMNLYALTPFYGAKVELSAATTVGLLTAFSIGGLVAQAPIGWLSDRLDRRFLLLVQGALTAAFCACIIMLGRQFVPLLYLLFFAYGATALTIYPVGIAFANSQLDSRHMVAASGGLLLLYSIGNILTPGIAAALMERFAPQMLFLMLGSGAALVAVAACLNLRRRMVPAAAPITRECLVPGANE
ncbi:MFS transporter [Chelatococcus sp. GCM10030263]|uniref:MFS transporter n=1 Tax=Chelatococcus sp. GCM10030263 TaxID=3273387 RepID=UPI003613AFA3